MPLEKKAKFKLIRLDKFNYIKNYVKHFFSAHSLDSIHSPFVFDFTSKIINSKDAYYAFIAIERERKKLLNNNQSITIEDYGAGSKVFKTNERKISDIAKTSLKPPKQAQLLFEIINYFKYRSIVELGTSLGITSAYLAKSSKEITLTTVEGSDEVSQIAKRTLTNLNVKNAQVITSTFDKAISEIVKSNPKIDCIFIDGNHQKEATIKYFEELLPYTHNNSLIIFDDIYWSKEMTEAWIEIKNHPKTKVSIDLFELGLIFFREEQPKEHFKFKFK